MSAKIDTLIDLVSELAAEGHRALVFSQFTTYLGMVRERRPPSASADVPRRHRDRAARIEQFREFSSVFLISLKAGGFGLALTRSRLRVHSRPVVESQRPNCTRPSTARTASGKTSTSWCTAWSAPTRSKKVVALQTRKRDLFDKVVGEAGDLAAPLTADDIEVCWSRSNARARSLPGRWVARMRA
ncbi:MAG: C-terminal helicase domain-containing protein [Micropruina glycogenica]